MPDPVKSAVPTFPPNHLIRALETPPTPTQIERCYACPSMERLSFFLCFFLSFFHGAPVRLWSAASQALLLWSACPSMERRESSPASMERLSLPLSFAPSRERRESSPASMERLSVAPPFAPPLPLSFAPMEAQSRREATSSQLEDSIVVTRCSNPRDHTSPDGHRCRAPFLEATKAAARNQGSRRDG
jgi:hypothetical protein